MHLNSSSPPDVNPELSASIERKMGSLILSMKSRSFHSSNASTIGSTSSKQLCPSHSAKLDDSNGNDDRNLSNASRLTPPPCKCSPIPIGQDSHMTPLPAGVHNTNALQQREPHRKASGNGHLQFTVGGRTPSPGTPVANRKSEKGASKLFAKIKNAIRPSNF